MQTENNTGDHSRQHGADLHVQAGAATHVLLETHHGGGDGEEHAGVKVGRRLMTCDVCDGRNVGDAGNSKKRLISAAYSSQQQVCWSNL